MATIAFQVNEAYHRVATAGASIEDARPAVDQARENYRLVRLRASEGNATPVEITDAPGPFKSRSPKVTRRERGTGTGRVQPEPVPLIPRLRDF